jgi:hypothetical protein
VKPITGKRVAEKMSATANAENSQTVQYTAAK